MKAEENPYWLWYQALQRSNRERWNEKVRTLLGPSDGLAFDEWWEDVREYFEEMPRDERQVLITLNSEQEVAAWWPDFGWDESFKLVAINLMVPYSVLEEEFAKLIRSLKVSRAGRPKHESFAPDFPLYRPAKPDIIEMMLKCLDAHAENASKPKAQRATLYELGVKVGLSPSHVVDESKEVDWDAEDKKIKMAVTFSRMVKRARTLIENVESGIFPKY